MPARATQRFTVRRSAGQSNARNTAGAAASRPKSRGSMHAAEERARQAAAQPERNRIPPVAQNAYRWAGRVSWPTAMAVVSSMTKCAVSSRLVPRGARISDMVTP